MCRRACSWPGSLARAGRPGEAVAEYARALEADPSQSEALYGRGMAFAPAAPLP